MAVRQQSEKEQRRRGRSAHRVNVNFSDDAYELLNEMAERRGTTISGVLRDALALEKLYEETILENGRVLLERPDCSLREVVRP